METLKKYWGILLLFLTSLAAIAFYFLKSRPRLKSSDSEEVNKLLTEEKAKLNEEKSQLEKEEKEIDEKDSSDAEIEKKYN